MRISVYIVDDHPIVRQGLRQLLEAQAGIKVVGESGDGQSALEEIQRLKPRVAVVDLQIPGLDGLALTRAIRSAAPKVAVVVLTMHAEESSFNAAIDSGAQGYILKENAVQDIILGVQSVASGGVFLSQAISEYLVRRHQRASALKEKQTGLASLSPTERRVLRLVAENQTNKMIGKTLCISERTVETHRLHISEKLDLKGRRKLLEFAIEHRSEL